MPDLGIPPFVVAWFMQDPLDALGVIAWGCFGIWALFYLDCSDGARWASDGNSGD